MTRGLRRNEDRCRIGRLWDRLGRQTPNKFQGARLANQTESKQVPYYLFNGISRIRDRNRSCSASTSVGRCAGTGCSGHYATRSFPYECPMGCLSNRPIASPIQLKETSKAKYRMESPSSSRLDYFFIQYTNTAHRHPKHKKKM